MEEFTKENLYIGAFAAKYFRKGMDSFFVGKINDNFFEDCLTGEKIKIDEKLTTASFKSETIFKTMLFVISDTDKKLLRNKDYYLCGKIVDLIRCNPSFSTEELNRIKTFVLDKQKKNHFKRIDKEVARYARLYRLRHGMTSNQCEEKLRKE